MKLERGTRHKTKEKIFLASAELFADKGFIGISMKDIAQKVGVKPSAIYNHYASKNLILDELLDYYLDRMQFFYKKLAETSIDIKEQKDLAKVLSKLMLSYDTDERHLMQWLTRIVHHEQFTNPKAAEALIGYGYKNYVKAHIHFFDRLSEAGLISGKENNKYYGELYARLSLTFGTQFLHPEIEPTIADQSELSDFVNDMVIAYEEKLLKSKKDL